MPEIFLFPSFSFPEIFPFYFCNLVFNDSTSGGSFSFLRIRGEIKEKNLDTGYFSFLSPPSPMLKGVERAAEVT